MTELQFLTREQAESVRKSFGTPVYVYDEASLRRNAEAVLGFPNAFGLTARYAMKANSNAAILQILDRLGLHIDASSGAEVERALRAGIDAAKISLSCQEFPSNLGELYEKGISINACSLNQLERFGELFPDRQVGLRINPGLGSGHSERTNTGGTSSSFGIWHENMDEVKALIEKFQLKIFRVHTHIGSGNDPDVWQRVAGLSLDLVRLFPDVTTLNLGGGFKVGLMSGEQTTDLQEIGVPVLEALEKMAEESEREIHLEIEPGHFLVGNAGCIVSTIQDIVSTGKAGYNFLKLDTGMTEILRPSLYGAQHPLAVFPKNDTGRKISYIVVGHDCESGDLLTPAPGQPERLQPRELAGAAIGDLCVIDGTGAYCAAMAAVNYNSFSRAPEVLLREDGSFALIRKRQTLDGVVEDEVPLNP